MGPRPDGTRRRTTPASAGVVRQHLREKPPPPQQRTPKTYFRRRTLPTRGGPRREAVPTPENYVITRQAIYGPFAPTAQALTEEPAKGSNLAAPPLSVVQSRPPLAQCHCGDLTLPSHEAWVEAAGREVEPRSSRLLPEHLGRRAEVRPDVPADRHHRDDVGAGEL